MATLLCLILSALSLLLIMPPHSDAADTFTVSAAMSLKAPFTELGRLHEAKHPGVAVRFNFGASGDLVRQIAAGAPVDVFASAAPGDMDDLEAKGLVLAASRADFAKNTVVLITPKPSGAWMKSFTDLASGTVKRIAVGNPKTAPVGRYAAEVFDHYGLAPKIKDKLILAENVRQILDYVSRGEVDAGVVYATDAAVRGAEVYIAAIAPEKSHQPVVYPVAVVKGSHDAAAAQTFINLLRSEEGRAILRKYGFRPL